MEQGTRVEPSEDINASRASRGGKVDLVDTEREGNRQGVVGGTRGLEGKQKVGLAEATRVTSVAFDVDRDKGNKCLRTGRLGRQRAHQ